MKNSRWILILPLVYVLFFSCKKDDDPAPLQVTREDNEFLKVLNKMHSRIDSVALSGHADEDFALIMVIHHEGGIDMANRAIKDGDDSGLKAIAQQILDRKIQEKDSLKTWLIGRKPTRNATGETFDAEMMSIIGKMKNLEDVQVVTGDADNDFAELMIIHNETVVEMSQSIMRLGHHDDMKAWAKQMVIDQNQATTDLSSWLKASGN